MQSPIWLNRVIKIVGDLETDPSIFILQWPQPWFNVLARQAQMVIYNAKTTKLDLNMVV